MSLIQVNKCIPTAISHGRCHSLPGRNRATDPRSGRRLFAAIESEQTRLAQDGCRLFCSGRGAPDFTERRNERCRSWPPRSAARLFSQDLSWVCGTKTASTEPALFSLKPILPQPARAGRSSTYPIGASTWSSTRTRRPQPQGQRTGKPCNLAKTRPQLPKKIKNRCLDPSQEKTGRMLQ